MKPERVTVITLTYRRPDDLRDALPLLVGAISDHPFADLLVIDNDTTPSAAPIVEAFGDRRVRYVHEPSPGIVAARNRGLDETRDSDVIVFIDDDERPVPGWLGLLLDLYHATGAEAVTGPVTGEIEGDVDPWIKAGRFFERRRYPTGTERPAAGTGNLLLDRAFVARAGLRFDEAFSASGGSDSVFTRQLRMAGGRILWCDEAVAFDVIPASRATREWVLQRARRLGNSEARSQIYLASGLSGWRERVRALVRGGARVGGGSLRWVRGVAISSLADRARGLRTVQRGVGMILAAVGRTHVEYRRPKTEPTSVMNETNRP